MSRHLIAILLTISCAAPATRAYEFTEDSRAIETTATIKLVEKFSRTPKLIKGLVFFSAAPRTTVREYDKGQFNIIGTMSLGALTPDALLTGEVPPELFGTKTYIEIKIGNLAANESDGSLGFYLKDDESFDPEKDKKVTVTFTDDINKKTALTIKLSWTDTEMKFSIKGKYDKVSTGNATVFAGPTLFACGESNEQPDYDYVESAASAEVAFVENAYITVANFETGVIVSAQVALPVVGVVNVRKKEIDGYTVSYKKLAFVGTNAEK